MSGRIRRCPADSTYTLSTTCPSCGGPTATTHPARFSPDDRRGRFRRMTRGWTK